MIGEFRTLPEHANRSNWITPFRHSVELKDVAMRRLVDLFPQYASTLAMRPERLVRVTFELGVWDHQHVKGFWRNVGVGPALDMTRGIASGVVTHFRRHLGGFREGDVLNGPHGNGEILAIPQEFFNHSHQLFCEYSNRFGDRYRIEQEFLPGASDQPTERLLVRFGDKWIEARS